MRATRRCLSWYFPGSLVEQPRLLRGRTRSVDYSVHCLEHSGPGSSSSAGDHGALCTMAKQFLVFCLGHVEFGVHDKTLVRLLGTADPFARVLDRRALGTRCSIYAELWRPSSPFRGRATIARKATT